MGNVGVREAPDNSVNEALHGGSANGDGMSIDVI
jgi:hypothetical protein